MEKEIPVKHHSKRYKIILLVIAIFIFFALDAIIIWMYFKSSRLVKNFSNSAQRAATLSEKFNFLKASADIYIPQEDISGADLTEVARYPQSIRTYYFNEASVINLEYQTIDDPKLVLAYFKKELVSKNFIVQKMTENMVVYKKDKITISLRVEQLDSLTTIALEQKTNQ